MNKISIVFMFAFVMMANILFSQNVTVNVTLLNNEFKSVDLQLAYQMNGKTPEVVATAEIKNDRFTLQTTIEKPDLYALYFGEKTAFLLCLNPNDKIDLTIDASDLQKVIAVSGSESVAFTKSLTDMFVKRKELLDSLNLELQHNATQLYFSDFITKFNPLYQAARAVDSDIASAVEKNDSMLTLVSRCAPDGTVNKKMIDEFLTAAVLNMKSFKNDYAAYKGYRDITPPMTLSDFGTIAGYDEFFADIRQYIMVSDDYRTAIASSFDLYYDRVTRWVDAYDELYFAGELESMKAKMNFAGQMVAIVNESGLPVQAKKAEFDASAKILNASGTKILNEARKNIQDIVTRYQTVYNDYNQTVNTDSRALILANKTELSTLMFIDRFAKDKALQTEVLNALHKKFPDHPLVAERYHKINTPQSSTANGNIAPELEFPDPYGTSRKLTDLRGKVVLIDFWASWCGPCRRENPNVVKLYNKYHDKGFEIYSVSLDNKKDNWIAAIKKDGLNWPNHVSDLKGWASAAARLYGVTSIPCTFLLDREGKILARGLRGADLENTLRQMFDE